jgi:hypothetical protein
MSRAWLVVAVPLAAVAILAGLSVASEGGSPAPVPSGAGDRGAPVSGKDAVEQANDAGVHGGPIERFHRTGACDLVDLGGLPGNWTHGDYVSAVAGLGDPALIPIAARSACGKPTVAVGRGGGPPEHAGLGGPPEHAGQGPPSWAPSAISDG